MGASFSSVDSPVNLDDPLLLRLTLVHAPATMAVPQRISLGKAPLIFGREPGEGGFVLEDLRASRQHTKLSFVPEKNTYRVQDLESRNGTMINGRKISSELLEADAVLRIGTCLFVYDSPSGKEELITRFRSYLEGDPRPMTTSAAEALLLHDWTADALADVAERARMHAKRSERIEAAHLELAERTITQPADDEPPSREHLMKLLRSHGGNVAEVARATGKHRPQVYRWLRRFGIDLAQFR